MHLGVRILLLACLASSGCAHCGRNSSYIVHDVPRELEMMSFPEYRVAPPDVLLIEAVDNIRHAGSPLQPGDTVSVQVANTLPYEVFTTSDDNPAEFQALLELEKAFKDINRNYLVDNDGVIDLGPIYGRVSIANTTPEQAQTRILEHLNKVTTLPNPKVSVTLIDIATKQTISGEHLINSAGMVSLGTYGSVYVSGMTIDEVRRAIESQLRPHLNNPQVSVDILAYNSKSFYVITDGGGYGEQVIRLPAVGNETVLDAIAQVQGLSQVSSKNIWIARPAPSGLGVAQILPVNWREISAEGVTTTNYQLLPGDRIYIQADRLIKLDNTFAKIISPVERVFGVMLLGDQVSDSFHMIGQFGNRGGNTGN